MNTIIIDGLSFALPLFVMAIGGIYSERSGVTNLAIEGLQGFGAFVGALFVVLVAGTQGTDSQTVFYLSFLFATLGGMAYALLHALLCVKFKANQVISGVVVNILAMALTAFLTKQINKSVFGAPSDKFQLGVSTRFSVPVLSDIPVLGAFFTNLYPFEIIIIVVAVVMWFLLYKTRFGLHLRACGDNPHAVDAAGRNVGQIRTVAVMISGALSGIGGMCCLLDLSQIFREHLRGLRLPGDRGSDLRELEDPAYSGCLPALWICPLRRLSAGSDPGKAKQLLRSGNDPSLSAHAAPSDFLLQVQPLAAGSGRNL